MSNVISKTLNSNGGSKGVYARYTKRAITLVLSVVSLALFWWLYVILAILVRVNLGSPVLFVQERPGKDGKTFKLYKFRSMSNARDENGNLLPDAQRLNKFGCILRSTSMDELPELVNIIKGDMSIIGPRPLLVEYLDFYNKHDARRHEMRPGLTGLAQVSGRNAISWKSKFERDVEYIDNVSFWLDVKIFFLTIKKVFIREGITFGENHQPISEYFKECAASDE